jgi:D-aminopeptidase
MSCYGYKGGIGTASRRAEHSASAYTVGAVVVANFGRPEELVIDGVRVGELLSSTRSGDFVLAFSTAGRVLRQLNGPRAAGRAF